MNAQELEQAAEEAGLVYVSDAIPGITRHPIDDGFEYRDSKGRPVTKEKELSRIRSLAIPPAYTDVWICPFPDGHLQATGKDARGRKQYRYHPRFREVRDESKFDRMAEFCDALPQIHERLAKDLAKRGLPREKVLAAIVTLLEKSLIRVGNAEYAKENKSYGLTTLRNRHVQVEGADVRFKFLGKSKIKHDITLHDRRLARVVGKLQELPGQELFQYLDDDGHRHVVTSNDVNAYLRQISGHDFTAKDFRTWAGTVLAVTELAAMEHPETKRATKAAVTQAVRAVARQLGNTPAVCRKCYVHPAVFEAFTTGTLRRYVKERDEESAAAVVRLLRAS
ncbi:MAG: DNA topoisomerase IB [Fimbriimonas sp.]